MIHLGAQLENDLGMEVIAIARPATAPAEDYVMEVCGAFLFFTVAYTPARSTWPATPMDAGNAPALLLRSRDDEPGWTTTDRLIRAMEEHGTRSLERPIEIGYGEGPDCWLIT